MLEMQGRPNRVCQGLSRRALLRAGVLGLGGLALPDLLRARATATPRAPGRDLSIVLVWLDGGPTHFETYDPKPEAPAEFRGPLKAIDTAAPGLQVSELLPYHARLMDKMSVIRSMHHDNGDHFAAAHWMLTGFNGSNAVNRAPQYPSAGSIITHELGAKCSGVPAYVGLPRTHSIGLAPGYHGAAYLGVAYNPFSVDGDPNRPNFRVPNLSLPEGMGVDRLDDRRGLRAAFDQIRTETDASGLLEGLDRFDQQAYELITGEQTRRAFDLAEEDPRTRDRYGRDQWGQSALVARRLVEAGSRFVTLTFGGWDHHSQIEEGMKRVLPRLDGAVGGLVDDLDQRGLLDSTLVLVMGEFGRTPRVNGTAGRDHWGNVMSVLVAGGGVAGGRAIGASNAKGETPQDLPLTPQDLCVTLYDRLGIDPRTTFVNHAGRPIPIGSDGQVIPGLF